MAQTFEQIFVVFLWNLIRHLLKVSLVLQRNMVVEQRLGKKTLAVNKHNLRHAGRSLDNDISSATKDVIYKGVLFHVLMHFLCVLSFLNFSKTLVRPLSCLYGVFNGFLLKNL